MHDSLQVLENLETRVRSDRVRGQLGYPPEALVPAVVLERIDREIQCSIPLVRTAAMYRIFAIASLTRESVALEGGITFHGAIGKFLGQVERLAVFLVTAGDAIDQKAQEEFAAGRILEGMVANAVGSEAADSATGALKETLRQAVAREELAITLPYSPGYCGMDLKEQWNVFSALDASRIGVRLLPSGIMVPIKSVSGVIGIGSPAVVDDSGSPCERCNKEDCNMRRYLS